MGVEPLHVGGVPDFDDEDGVDKPETTIDT